VHEIELEQLRRKYNINSVHFYLLETELRQKIEPLLISGIITSEDELAAYLKSKNRPLISTSTLQF